MKLLVSVVDESEAIDSYKGGADIVDVKNPREGALGASYPWIIGKAKRSLPSSVEISCTIGDFPNLPGTASLAARGATTLGVDYVKIGLFGVRSRDAALFFLKQANRAVREVSSSTSLVATAYGDYSGLGSLNPLSLPEIAEESGVWGVMMDLKQKSHSNLFDILGIDIVEQFVRLSHSRGLNVGLAGGLGFKDLPTLLDVEPDIVGVRRSVCEDHEGTLRLKKDLVNKISKCISTVNFSKIRQ